MKSFGLGSLIVILAACGANEPAATTAETAGETAAATTAGASNDLSFATTASMANLYEIRAGQLALEKSTNDAYRSFAQAMVDQHGEIGAVYARLAQEKGLPLPEGLSGEVEQLYQALMDAPDGHEFDALYRKQMLDTHKSAVALFQQEAKNGQDQALKEFAERFLDTIEMHLEMAKALPPAQ